MKKRPELLAKSLSGLTALALVFSTFPAMHIHAEDMAVVEETSAEGTIPSVYTVTEFMDFQKNEEGKFVNEETQTKYGALTAQPGTPLSQLGLPAELILNGYYEADGPEILTTMELSEFDWILKSDIGEIYSEAMPEGTYTFIPDLDTYVSGTDGIDEIKLAEGLKMLSIPVTIALPAVETEAPVETEPPVVETESVEPVPAETEYVEPAPVETEYVEPTPAETEFVEPAPAETEYVEPAPAETEYVEPAPVETEYVEPAPAETEYVEPAPAETEYVEPAPAETEYVEPAPAETEYVEPAPTDSIYTEDGAGEVPAEEDIFSGLDDSLLEDADSGEVIIYDENGAPVDVYDDNSVTDPGVVGDGTGEDDGVVDPSDTPDDTSAPVSTTTADLTITDSAGNLLYSHAETLNLSSDVNAALPAVEVSLGCGVALNSVNVNFALPEGTTYYVYPEDGSAANDFSQNPSKIFIIEVTNADYSFSIYRVSVTINKAAHTWGEPSCTGSNCANCTAVDESTALGHDLADATCSAPATCKRCGYQEGTATGEHTWVAPTCETAGYCSTCQAPGNPALGHKMSAATCTEPATCQNGCGYTDGKTLEHQWTKATCTAPKTCAVCQATDGTALGHKWTDATCITPKTCKRCQATDGTALGHKWTDATCTTPKTCKRCQAVEGAPLGHSWIDATCTTPKTCDTCGATEGKSLGHSLQDDWQIIRNSTDTVHGEESRHCHRDTCDYSETRALNIIANPNSNAIANLTEGGQYNLNNKITFTAVGAAMGNTNPINGDVRYVPTSWNIQNTPGNFMDNFTGAFSITQTGSYTVTVTFQKQLYQDGWKATDVVDNKSVTFTVGTLVQGTLVQGTADGIKINPQTGDSTPIIPLVIAVVVALAAIIGVIVYKKKRC